MKSAALTILTLAALCRAQEPGVVDAPLADRLPALLEQSAWRLDATPATPDAARGAFALGNGIVRATLGLTPATIGPIFGPKVTGREGERVELALVDRDGNDVHLPQHRVRRVLDAGFVVGEDASDRAALRTSCFAPAHEPRILVAVDVVADGGASLDGLRLRATAASGASLEVPLGAAGAWRGAIRITLADGRAALEQFDRTAVAMAAATELDAWRERLAGTTRYDSDHLKLRDLLRDWKVAMLELQSADTGVVTPPDVGGAVTVRSQNGPLLALLRFGLWSDARRILDHWWDASIARRRIPRTADTGPDLAAAKAANAEAARAAEFWQSIEVPPGDVGSWIVLQHFWYWRATRDTALIEARWPLIDCCLKRQLRREEILIPFGGDEPWVSGFAALPTELLGGDPGLIGDDPPHGRSSDSFASSVAFLMALHAVGDMVDALDRSRTPARWQDGAPDPTPSAPYVRRAFGLMAAIEKRYWQEDLGMFAPALSPVDAGAHRAVVANASLLPLWIGWTFPTGERSRDNLRNALRALAFDGARVGTTRTVGATTGDLQGLLLTALSERDGAGRKDALDALLTMAEPAGTWATFHGPDGRPLTGVGARLDPGTSGVDVDAILFAVTGIRQAAYANWDDDDIRLKLRLPHGASWFAARGTHKDGRTLDVFFREEVAVLSEEERRANDDLDPARRRDPSVPHRRLKFVVELVEGRPPKGYYDVAINAEGVVYVRYLKPQAPASPDDPDLRRIEEMEFAADDTLVFLPGRSGPGEALAPRERSGPSGARILALTCRGTAAEFLAGPATALFDTGRPFEPREIESILLDGDAPRVARLFLDWRYTAPRPAGWSAWWTSAAWGDLLERYRAVGGQVAEPDFLRSASVDGRALSVREDGALLLPAGDTHVVVRATLRAEAAREVVLRLGANAPYVARFAGKDVARGSPASVAEPDRASTLVTLAPGDQEIEIDVAPREDGGARVLFVRTSGPDGLPAR